MTAGIDAPSASSTSSSDSSSTLPSRKRNGAKRVLDVIVPIGAFAVLLIAWSAVVRLAGLPPYIAPAPENVLPRMWEERQRLIEQSWVTLEEILLGFGLSIVTAIPAGLMIAVSAMAKRALYPLLVFTQLVPKIAIAPLFLVWFGFGMQSKVLLTMLMTFFPLLLASISGFQILDQRLLYLTKTMGASVWQTFYYLRFPAALPVIFSGLKTAATMAATAAIVAEFVGSNNGLGFLLLQATSQLDTELIFAVLVVLTLIGVAMNYLVEFVEYLLTPWQRAIRK